MQDSFKNAGTLSNLFDKDMVNCIKAIPFCRTSNKNDYLVWNLTPNGNFSISSAYDDMACKKWHFEINNDFGWIWKIVVTPSSYSMLSLVDFSRWASYKNVCIFCNNHEESPEHLFRECSFIRSIWNIIGWAFLKPVYILFLLM